MHRLPWTGTAGREEFGATRGLWYHSYHVDNGYEVRGEYAIGIDLFDHGFPSDMTGMKVLDIGSGAGWFSFYFEQLGAEVTAVDIRAMCDLDLYGRWKYARPTRRRAGPAGRGGPRNASHRPTAMRCRATSRSTSHGCKRQAATLNGARFQEGQAIASR